MTIREFKDKLRKKLKPRIYRRICEGTTRIHEVDVRLREQLYAIAEDREIDISGKLVYLNCSLSDDERDKYIIGDITKFINEHAEG